MGLRKLWSMFKKIETLYIWCRMQAPLCCSLEGWFLTLLRNLFILTSRSGNCGLVRGHPSMRRDHCEVLGWLASHWSPCLVFVLPTVQGGRGTVFTLGRGDEWTMNKTQTYSYVYARRPTFALTLNKRFLQARGQIPEGTSRICLVPGSQHTKACPAVKLQPRDDSVTLVSYLHPNHEMTNFSVCPHHAACSSQSSKLGATMNLSFL